MAKKNKKKGSKHAAKVVKKNKTLAGLLAAAGGLVTAILSNEDVQATARELVGIGMARLRRTLDTDDAKEHKHKKKDHRDHEGARELDELRAS